MATRRGERVNLLELRDRTQDVKNSTFRPHRRPNEFIERTVLPTDTLQGIALLYNTSVAEIKKLNLLQTDGELHARRVIKVPSRGILINLEPVSTPGKKLEVTPSGSGKVRSIEDDDLDLCDVRGATEGAGLAYLNNKDSLLTEIRAKVDYVAANSPILNEGEDHEFSQIRKGVYGTTIDRKNDSVLKWWHVLFPCLGFIILFPILLFVFQEHLNDLGHSHDHPVNPSSTDFLHVPSSASEYIVPEGENGN